MTKVEMALAVLKIEVGAVVVVVVVVVEMVV